MIVPRYGSAITTNNRLLQANVRLRHLASVTRWRDGCKTSVDSKTCRNATARPSPRSTWCRCGPAWEGRRFRLDEADICCAPGYVGVTFANWSAEQPALVFIAGEAPLRRNLGAYEVRA